MEPINATIAETMRLIPAGRSKVYEFIATKQLEAVKLGRRTLVRMASIKALSDSLSKAA